MVSLRKKAPRAAETKTISINISNSLLSSFIKGKLVPEIKPIVMQTPVPNPLVSVGNYSKVVICNEFSKIFREALVRRVTTFSACLLPLKISRKKKFVAIKVFTIMRQARRLKNFNMTFENREARSSVVIMITRFTN